MILGVIADDMTGASDVALTLSKGGLRVMQVMEQADDYAPYQSSDVIVAALKTRTAPVADAIEQSLAACEKLMAVGARQILLKICSTFDSTPEGNIGPVADALKRRLRAPATIVCPAFPENGRTVYQGYLFVGHQLLHESPMKDHPLTPMRDSSLARLLGAQSRERVEQIHLNTVNAGADSVEAALAAAESSGVGYLVADAVSESDLITLADANKLRPLLVGGSGIALGLPSLYRRIGLVFAGHSSRQRVLSKGRAAIIAGSCSLATRKQIAEAISAGMPAKRLNPAALADSANFDAACEWAAAQNPNMPVLIYTSDDPEKIEQVRRNMGPESATVIENALGEIARLLIAQGFDKLIVAGGETSGAVVRSISLRALEVGPEIAPGVPWMYSADHPKVAIALKSGNFGGDRFFLSAWDKIA